MQPEISVITCAHNSKPDNLEQTLAALKSQTLGMERWEYLLVDNGSAEPLAARVDLSWHPNGRHVREDKLGLTHARLRGISKSRGDVLVFVDDDNVLNADYLEQVIAVSEKHQMIGAWGGQCHPVFEETPPSWTKRYWGSLALREFDRDYWSNVPFQALHTMPNGAGLCVRRAVADYYAALHSNGRRSFVLDRTGQSLISGGDTDLAGCACDIGLGVGVFTALKLNHLIPKARLHEDYLLRLVEGIAYSSVILNSFRGVPGTRTRRSWSGKLADLLRMLRMTRRERRFSRARQKGERRGWDDLSTNRATERVE